MQEELMINFEAFEANQDDYDNLKEAILKLTKTSQEQFEDIKKEKWYNRVFDMITFSHKGEKRIAEQIGTVAQAQQILIELLLRLSENDANVSALVAESIADIKKMQENDIYLLSRINKLENISLGIRYNNDINLLSEKNKQLLSGCMYYISEHNDCPSDEQRKFANIVLKYINSDIQMDNPLAGIENIDNDSKKRILSCCMEYMFLYNCKIECIDKFNEFIDEFDFGKKTIRIILKQIQSLYNLRGLDGFFEKYQQENFEKIDDIFTIELEEFESENDSSEVETEMEDCYISNILQVRVGDTKRFDYKKVHLSAYINCEGNLEFNNCIIYYNESNNCDEISLAQNSNLVIRDSTIICKGLDKTSFISGKGNNSIELINNTFIDCSYFIKLDSGNNFVLKECELHNCYYNFLELYMNDDDICEISNNIILEDKLADFNKKLDTRSIINKSLISITRGYYVKGTKKYLIYNNTIIENETFRHDKTKGKDIEMQYIHSDSLKVYNCTFIGAVNCITATSVVNCKFENCKNIINAPFISSKLLVDNCIFNNCTEVINNLAENSKVSNCQFVSCYDCLIKPSLGYGGVTIEFCEFINTKYFKKESDGFKGLKACIILRRLKNSDTSANYIKKCIFNGAELNNAFLIAADGYEKPRGTVTYIEDCSFKNCSTKRSSGKIIKKYLQYDTFFGNEKDFHANEVLNCRGLDRVNKEGKEVELDSIEIKENNTNGDVIGSTLIVDELEK